MHKLLFDIVNLYLVHTGGAFKLELFLPEDYPMAAPKVRASLAACKLLRTATLL